MTNVLRLSQRNSFQPAAQLQSNLKIKVFVAPASQCGIQSLYSDKMLSPDQHQADTTSGSVLIDCVLDAGAAPIFMNHLGGNDSLHDRTLRIRGQQANLRARLRDFLDRGKTLLIRNR